MLLKTRCINIETGHKYIAVLSENTALKLDLHPGDRVRLSNNNNGADLTAILDVSKKSFPDDTVGLFRETYEKLHCKPHEKINIEFAEKPLSTKYIKKKLAGKNLTDKEIEEIVKDITEDNFSDIEMTYFVSGCYTNGLSKKETTALTKAIVKHGSKLTFSQKIIADKHCIGGVPGNRTTMIITPIVSSTGIIMPKTSSKAITSPAGTADTMEVLANVSNSTEELQKIIKKTNGIITWGGGVDLASADDYLIRVRYPLSLDPEGMLLSSIMAKKHAVSATHVLIDIPIGKQVKIKNLKEANHLKKRFIDLGKTLHMKTEVMFSKGDQPVGNGIGPLLEAIDVMNVLRNNKNAPQDLREKGLKMAGILFELTKKTKKGEGFKMAEKILKSGKALQQMEKIIDAQGRKIMPQLAKYRFPYPSMTKGKVKTINNKVITRIARMAGAPKAKQAGLYLHKKLNDPVRKGENLFTIYASSPDRLKHAVSYALNNKAYDIK